MLDRDYMYMNLHVTNFDKWHSDATKKKYFYFKCDAGMVDSPDFFDFTAEEFKAWIYILSLCARSRSATIQINLVHARRNARVRTKNFLSSVKKLQGLGAVSILTEEKTPRRVEKSREEERREEESKGEDRTEIVSSKLIPEPLPEFLPVESVIREREITSLVQRAWLEAYPDSGWVVGEIKKAIAWEAANPGRKKKQFARFMGNWLSKGWDNRKLAPLARTQNYAANREAGNLAALEAYKKSLKEGA